MDAPIPATTAKNEFGRILEKAIRGETVVISKHDSPKAVLISMERYHALMHRERNGLDALTAEFDALLARMQTPAARGRMQRAFSAPPKRLGTAAVAAVRKRG